MGEWVTGAAINVVGSISINFGTNLLKLGHNQREKSAVLEANDGGEKTISRKSITDFQAWRFGVVVFSLGNCLNFVSFGFAAQSLLAALGSVQFVSNVVFAYFVLKETVTQRTLLATAFIVVGNVFLVFFGNHESETYTTDELMASYKNPLYLGYCLVLLLIVVSQHLVYKYLPQPTYERYQLPLNFLLIFWTNPCTLILFLLANDTWTFGRCVPVSDFVFCFEIILARYSRHLMLSRGEDNVGTFWRLMVPCSYSVVSGAIGTHSVLFAKSLSILMRLTISGESQMDAFFIYLIFFLFLGTASFWMARLNEGLAMFESILIVPMLQIAWTFFSIFTGFIYFQEYQGFDGFRGSMFALGMSCLFLGMTLLAPRPPKGLLPKATSEDPLESIPLMEIGDGSIVTSAEQRESKDKKTVFQALVKDAMAILQKAKTSCQMTLGIGQDRLPATSVFAMPMPMLPSSRIQWKTTHLSTDWLARLSMEDAALSSGIASVNM